MLKRFFVGGTLAAVISLTGGVGAAAAEGFCPNESVFPTTKPNYTRMVVKPIRSFDNVFVQKNTMYGDIKWFFQGPVFRCIDEKTGNYAWAASYNGVGN
ncbi:hypothetical protein [Xenorhabdus innexi]|uniref:Uncharacterized protein n=1 Tax=Xenorhabdus innexi TaxID=290109 RepID=A0A1N6MXP6_9GAMM|nr:hypothetical protein [Xenorhabdus innexi]PHM31205.1 hypothetical protein Xinn_02983 [Xenorhabdus innexi]SIP73653.1 conserved exported hypothetical protein [Xenorhabdus innexi]